METFEQVYTDFSSFSLETFKKATAHSCILHLKEEVKELETAEREEPIENIVVEAADCVLTIISCLCRLGIDPQQLVFAMSVKTHINKNRKWKLNPNNTYSHIKE